MNIWNTIKSKIKKCENVCFLLLEKENKYPSSIYWAHNMKQELYTAQKNQGREITEFYIMSGFMNYIKDIKIFQKIMRCHFMYNRSNNEGQHYILHRLLRHLQDDIKSKKISGISNQRINMEVYKVVMCTCQGNDSGNGEKGKGQRNIKQIKC